MTEKTTLPSYNDIIENGKWNFLQKIEQQETINEETRDKTINFIENTNTGGKFIVYNKNGDELGTLYLYQGKLYIINDNTQNITPLITNTFEDLNNLRNTYNIYYEDKEKQNKKQKVSIEDENNIQVDKGVVLSFNKINSKNPNSELYLKGIYDGEFKEKTTEVRKLLTGNCNLFYKNGNIYKQGSLENGLFKEGKRYSKNGKLYCEGTFIQNKEGHTLLNGKGKRYYKNGTLWKEGIFKDDMLNGEGKWYYKNGKLWEEGTFKDGKLNGKGKWYREDGTFLLEGTFKDDKLNGEGKYYREDGTLLLEGTFKDGMLSGKNCIEYYEDGKTQKCVGTFENGLFKEGKYYYENGKLYCEGTFVQNKEGYTLLNGEGKRYRKDGKLYQEGTFKDDMLNGEGKRYYKNGTLCQEGTFADSELDGDNCIEYYKDGTTPKCVGTFENGLFKEGKWYYKNGTLCQEGTFVQNKEGYTLLNGEGKRYNEDGKLYQEGTFKDDMLNGEGKRYYKNGTLCQEGTFADSELDGDNCIEYYKDGTTPKCVGTFENGLFKEGKWYRENGALYQEGTFKDNKLNGEGKRYNEDGKLYQEGTFKDNKLNGQNCKRYHPITIQQGEFKDDYLYSGSAYLREDPTGKTIEQLNNEQINPDNKIYTLERDKENPNKRIITFHTKHSKIGLDRDIQIHIDENNIATLQTIKGEQTELTEDEINKIKAFFNNISIEQLWGFDIYFATLYCPAIMNKEKYKDINILIPDLCEYYYKEGEEVTQTINLIHKIPQDKRKGIYAIHCWWLRFGHQVNLRIDFDNKICEIVNPGGYIDKKIINDLKNGLNNQFGGNWIVYENNIINQSTGNCVIASNIVTTEKIVIKEEVKEYNEKIKKLKEADKKIGNIEKKYEKQYKDYEVLKEKLFTKCDEYLEQHNKTEEDDKSKLNFLLDKTNTKIKQLNTPEQQKKKRGYERIKKQIQQALDLLDIKEYEKETTQLKQELQEILNTIINNNNKDAQQTLTVEELEEQIKSFLKQYNNKIEQIVINELLYQDLRNEVNKLKGKKQEVPQKQTIEERINNIKQDTERLQEYKENCVRTLLILQLNLLNKCENQFNKYHTQEIINDGYAITVSN